MKWLNQRLCFHSKPKVTTELLRRYVEGDLSLKKRTRVQETLETSESLRIEHDRLHKTVTALTQLPRYSPPERVWRNIARELHSVQPESVWFPWWYRHPVWVKAFGIAGCMVAMFLIGISQTHWDSSYQLVVIQDGSGFQDEAESYLAHHDLSGVPPFTRVGLVAFYTLRPAGPYD